MARIDELIRELLETAVASDEPAGLIERACAGLCELGVPLWRLSISIQAIDPTIQAVSYVWRRDEHLLRRLTPYGPDPEHNVPFRTSPIHALLQEEALARHWRLDQGQLDGELPLLGELRTEGATSYYLRLVRFGGAIADAVPGVAISMATDRPGGFAEADIATFEGLTPAVGLAAYRFMLARMSQRILGVYLGERTARRVLAGEVRRGTGRAIEAAILLADLRGFTALAGREPAARVVAWLDQHLEAIGEPVAANGGEVLKFLGDGLLAVFPVEEGTDDREACRRALAAAEQAMAATAELNARRRAAGEPELGLDLVLHFGEVVYGNVGAARRLDFTVIGPTVNEASRIEALCAELGRPLLLSGPFAARCGRPTASLGRFALRGCPGETEVRELIDPA
ncbi:MAG: adenylate/guanylate cyclase domain-containing protein [Geminicoccaceae bacterium]